ncbi:uncharacterized protein [Chelonus insularis]|uniref:uncharacterized protein isoform X2 n=1 Tax=Chelonus insularis TaxID=460826 RepID=UPI00158E8CDC|nr:uncharacterized protein LOC118075118 isoform X2 [Chelonus insularis]
MKIVKKSISTVETLYMTLTYFLISCLSYIILEIGARSPLGHSVTRAATFNALFRRNYDIKIKIPIENCFSAIITTALMCVGEKWKIPHLFLPWLLNIIIGLITHEAPTLFILLYNQLSYSIFSGSIFAITAMVLIVEQLCILGDVISSFKRCWLEQKYMNLFDTNHHNINHNDENKSKNY